MELTERSALVTGGASGLGAATVRRLHTGGAGVVIVDLPTSAGAQLADELGERAIFVPADVTDSDQVAVAIDAAASLGQFSVVVNCAGIGTPGRIVAKNGDPLALDTFARVIQVNLIGTFNVIRLAAAAMIATPGEGEERGVIVNTASIAAFDGQIGQAAYAASKGGIAGMTLPIARDLAQHRIRCTTIAPGLFLTPLLMGLPEDAVAALGAGVPHPSRLGDPSEYAALVAHIVANPMLNGETIRLDGATRLAPK